MSVLKILVAPGDKAGSGKCRCLDPHLNLQKNHSDKFFVNINYNVNFEDDEYLKKFDVVFIHRLPQHNIPKATEIIKKIQSLGIKVIVDTDDYWDLDISHGLYTASKQMNLPKVLVNCLRLADLVTVPTEIFANEVKKINKNVVVLPNAIDPEESQFKPKEIKSDFIRVGWLGGSSHIDDLQVVKSISNKNVLFDSGLQLVLCGFDTRGVVSIIDPQTKEKKERPMKPEETVWFRYEKLFTDDYKIIENDKDYIEFLKKFDSKINYDINKKPYKRIWTKPINSYACGYNEFDISLAPLKESKFNMYKSQLKVIEAGFHKKALIAQNYGPYTIDLISAIDKGGNINSKGNCLLVDPNKNHKNWYKYVKKLMEDSDLRKMISENLYDTVKEKYNLNNVTNYRAEMYIKYLK